MLQDDNKAGYRRCLLFHLLKIARQEIDDLASWLSFVFASFEEMFHSCFLMRVIFSSAWAEAFSLVSAAARIFCTISCSWPVMTEISSGDRYESRCSWTGALVMSILCSDARQS